MAIKIGLDPGHGLKTAGKQTPTGIKEWTLNDKVCDKVAYFAEKEGLSAHARSAVARKKA